jgi:hypothetical protein
MADYCTSTYQQFISHNSSPPRIKWIVSSLHKPEIEQKLNSNLALASLTMDLVNNADQVTSVVRRNPAVQAMVSVRTLMDQCEIGRLAMAAVGISTGMFGPLHTCRINFRDRLSSKAVLWHETLLLFKFVL